MDFKGIMSNLVEAEINRKISVIKDCENILNQHRNELIVLKKLRTAIEEAAKEGEQE